MSFWKERASLPKLQENPPEMLNPDLRRLRAYAAVDLTGLGPLDVIGAIRPKAILIEKAVRSCRDGLGPEGLRLPVIGHLLADDARQIGLQGDEVDGVE